MTTTTMEKANSGQVTRAERTRARHTFRPSVDIIEREDELTVFADMPGACAEDVDIKFENGSLTIFASITDRLPRDGCLLAQEYEIGDYLRTFEVGEVIDSERITAEMNHGVLTLHLPKTERVRPRKIKVKGF